MAKRRKSTRSSGRSSSGFSPKSSVADTSLSPTPLRKKLQDLQADRQWILKQIRRKRTELDNFIEQMRSIAIEVFKSGASLYSQIQELDAEIHSLFDEILTQRKLGKKSRKDVEKVYRSLQMQGIISFKSLGTEDMVEDEDDDFFHDVAQDHTEGESFEDDPSIPHGVEPTDPPDRNLRQTFLRLASIYHPDRAEDEDVMAQHTEIMKEINRAYQSGDFARLLELEQQQITDASELQAPGDDLENACEQLNQENRVLRNQYEEIKAELRELRNSTHEGQLVTYYRRVQKEGIDFVGEIVEVAQKELERAQEIRDFVRDFRDKKITIKTFMRGPQSFSKDDLVAALEELGIIILDPDDMF